MLFPALGLMTAIWLLMVPLLSLDTGFRAGLALVIGVVGLILSPLGFWSQTSRRVVGVAGGLLAFMNFAVPASTGGMANFAACGSLLIIAALAPQPVSQSAAAVAAPSKTVVAQPKPAQRVATAA